MIYVEYSASYHMLSTTDKTAYLFNKLYFDFVKDVKKNCDTLKPALKTHYKTVKLFDHGLIQEYGGFIKDALPVMVNPDVSHAEVFDKSEVSRALVFKDIPLASVVEHMPDEALGTVKSYIYIFAILSIIYTQCDEELSELCLRVLTMIQNQEGVSDITKSMEDILDDDVVHLFKQLHATFSTTVKIDTEPTESLDFDETFKSSKIGSLAREITDEMDLKDVKPEELLNLSNMGNIVNKVGSKIQSKINSGELKQEELAQEVFSFLGAMGKGGPGNILNNPMMKEMMKNFGGAMGGGSKAQVNTAALNQKMKSMSTQDRLRKKLDERKAAADPKH